MGYWTLKPATCIMTVAWVSTLASIQTPFILASVSNGVYGVVENMSDSIQSIVASNLCIFGLSESPHIHLLTFMTSSAFR